MHTRLILRPEIFAWAGAMLNLSFPSNATASQPNPWDHPAARIEQHRKGEFVVRVIDTAGQAKAGVPVRVAQQQHAFLFGCNIFQWDGLPNAELQQAYRDRYAALFNYATLPFYWTSYELEQGRPRHDQTQAVAEWCQAQGIITKGHPLAWNMGDPRWLPDDLDAVYRLQLERITDCVTRFRGLIDRWDVVNEPTHFDREEFVQRRAPKHSAMWQKQGRIPFTRACFEVARQAGPEAILLINDYRTDPAYEAVIRQLVDNQGRRLYDAIGIQSHMHRETWSNEKIWDVCERFGAFSVPLHFTETTVLSGERGWERTQPWPTTPDGESRQAEETVRFYTLLFSHPAVEAITWWDFCDFYAWQRAPAGFLRRDMSPKPVYDALLNLIKGEWWTDLQRTTDAQGEIRGRAFLGRYQVTAEIGEAPVSATFDLRRGEASVWTVRVR